MVVQCKCIVDGIQCPRPAFWHIRNAMSAKVTPSFSCVRHLKPVSKLIGNFVELHRVQGDCGMPGAVWDDRENVCIVPTDVCEPLANALRHSDQVPA